MPKWAYWLITADAIQHPDRVAVDMQGTAGTFRDGQGFDLGSVISGWNDDGTPTLSGYWLDWQNGKK